MQILEIVNKALRALNRMNISSILWIYFLHWW